MWPFNKKQKTKLSELILFQRPYIIQVAVLLFRGKQWFIPRILEGSTLFHLHRRIQEGTLPNLLFLFRHYCSVLWYTLKICSLISWLVQYWPPALPCLILWGKEHKETWTDHCESILDMSIVSQPAAWYSDLRCQTRTPNGTSLWCESNKNFTQLLNQKLKIKSCHVIITPPLKAGMPLHSENWIIDSDWPTVASVNSTPLTSSQLQRAVPCVHCTRRGLINDLPAASPSNLLSKTQSVI